MNAPEYILTDEMQTVVAAVKTKMLLPVLNYQYGFIEELNQTLKQYEDDPVKYAEKFPLVWLAEPFDTIRGDNRIYGTADPDIFIFNSTDKTWKAKDRMDNNFKPILYPIYRELLNQIVASVAFDHSDVESIKHRLRKGYYWDKQATVFNDAVDCLKIGGTALRIQHKLNC